MHQVLRGDLPCPVPCDPSHVDDVSWEQSSALDCELVFALVALGLLDVCGTLATSPPARGTCALTQRAVGLLGEQRPLCARLSTNL